MIASIPGIGSIAVLSLLTGCALDSGRSSGVGKVILSLEPTASSPAPVSTLERIFTPGFSMLAVPTPPSAGSGFDCYAVNVMGDDIQPRKSNDNKDAILRGIAAGSSCSYAGIVSKTIKLATGQTSAEVELAVPTGKGRIIQLAGLVDNGTGVCLTSGRDPDGDYQGQPGAYELGRTIQSIEGDTAVTITNSYNSLTAAQKTTRRMNCGSLNETPVLTGSVGTPSGSASISFTLAANFVVTFPDGGNYSTAINNGFTYSTSLYSRFEVFYNGSPIPVTCSSGSPITGTVNPAPSGNDWVLTFQTAFTLTCAAPTTGTLYSVGVRTKAFSIPGGKSYRQSNLIYWSSLGGGGPYTPP